MNTGNGEVSREVNIGGILDGGEEVLGSAVSIDIGKEVRWLDRVIASASSSEVVGGGY